MINTIKHLEKHYNTDVTKLIQGYSEGLSMKDMATSVGIGEMPCRTICAVLNLRFKQRHRENDLKVLASRMADGGNPELLDRLSGDLEVLQKEVYKNARTIQNLKDGNSVLKGCIRQQAREEYFDGILLSELKNQFSELTPSVIALPKETTKDGTMFMVLSDVHYNEVISSDVTNGVNVMNNNICKARILELVNQLVRAKYNTDKLRIYILGDMVNGFIHLGQTVGDVPPLKSVVELSEFLGGIFKSLSKAYNNVEIRMVNGNHSRVNDIQKSYHKAYDLEYVLFHMLQAQLQDIKMEYSTNGYLVDIVEGMPIGLLHGDTSRSYSGHADASAYKIQNIIENLYGVRVVSLISGHTHKAIVASNQFGGVNIVNGCTSGINEYGLTGGFDTIVPIQTIGRISEGRFREVHQVYLGDINDV